MGKTKYTAENILSFLEGTTRYYLDKINDAPAHIQEQVTYRLYQCKDDCLIENKCVSCGCPPKKKAFVTKSCNPERFGDLLSREDWEKFKRKDG